MFFACHEDYSGVGVGETVNEANRTALYTPKGDKRTGILHTAIYDDGQVQQELIQL